jgi:hypothetical protein
MLTLNILPKGCNHGLIFFKDSLHRRRAYLRSLSCLNLSAFKLRQDNQHGILPVEIDERSVQSSMVRRKTLACLAGLVLYRGLCPGTEIMLVIAPCSFLHGCNFPHLTPTDNLTSFFHDGLGIGFLFIISPSQPN